MKTKLLALFTLLCIQTACSGLQATGNHLKTELINPSTNNVGNVANVSTGVDGMNDITKPYDIQVGKSTLEEAKKLLAINGWVTDEQNYKFDGLAKFRSVNVLIAGYHFYRFYNSYNEDGIILYIDGNSTVQRLTFLSEDKTIYDNLANAINKFQNKPKPSIFRHFYTSDFFYFNLNEDNLGAEILLQSKQRQHKNLTYFISHSKTGTIEVNKPIMYFAARHIYLDEYSVIDGGLYEIPKSITNKLAWQDSEEGSAITIVSDKYLNDYNKPICSAINQTQNNKKREYLLSGLAPNICPSVKRTSKL